MLILTFALALHAKANLEVSGSNIFSPTAHSGKSKCSRANMNLTMYYFIHNCYFFFNFAGAGTEEVLSDSGNSKYVLNPTGNV